MSGGLSSELRDMTRGWGGTKKTSEVCSCIRDHQHRCGDLQRWSALLIPRGQTLSCTKTNNHIHGTHFKGYLVWKRSFPTLSQWIPTAISHSAAQHGPSRSFIRLCKTPKHHLQLASRQTRIIVFHCRCIADSCKQPAKTVDGGGGGAAMGNVS